MKWSLLCAVCFSSIYGLFGWEIWDSAKDLVFGEQCSDRWVHSDISDLKYDLRHRVFGQPFLEEALIPLLQVHLDPQSRRTKALVLSFHGSPGVGKTYVSQVMASYMFKEGHNSRYCKFFSMGDSIAMSKEDLRNSIVDTAKLCERSLFIFDEIEKMPEGFIDVIKTFLDFHPRVNDIDFRKCTFIFVSNTGMDKINELSLSLWKDGINRNKFKLSKFEQALIEPAYNEKGGLKGTSIVFNYLINLYLPFLPLEKEHVIKCIQVEAKNMHMDVTGKINDILENLVFLPPGIELYSASGCKSVSSLVLRYGKHKRSEL